MSYGLESYDSVGRLIFSTADITTTLVGVFVLTMPANAITASIFIEGGLLSDDIILTADPLSSFLDPIVRQVLPNGLQVTLNLYHLGGGRYDRRNFAVNYYLTVLRVAR